MGNDLSPTPAYGHPSHEGNKKLIPLYKRGGMRSHDGVFSFSHPALWAPLTEGNKVLIPLYKRGGMRSHVGVVSLLPPRPAGTPH